MSSLFVTEKTVAEMLGRSIAWLRSNAHTLEQTTGFPKIDPVVGKRHREAIEVWARERNVRSVACLSEQDETNSENEDAF